LKILIFGGTGFVGINIAAALLARGHRVTLFDRAALPRAAWQAFATYGDLLKLAQGDVTEPHSVENIIASGFDAIILGAAITAGPARDAADPQSILHVNLLAQLPILMAARRCRVGRIINLSSAAAYGAAAFQHATLDEETACDPVSLYAVTKYASEKVAARLAEHQGDDDLTPRELEVLELIRDGQRNKDIAEKLEISEATVNFHVKNILDKLGANDRTHAVTLAVRRGMMQI